MIVTLLGLGALHQTRGDSVAGGPRSQFCDHTAPSGELPTPRSHQTMVIRAKPPGGRAFASCPPRWEPVASACPPGRTDPVGPTTTHWQGPTLRATCRAARIPAPDRRFHRPRTMTTPPALGSSVQRFHAVVRRPCMSSSRPEVPMPHFGAALRGLRSAARTYVMMARPPERVGQAVARGRTWLSEFPRAKPWGTRTTIALASASLLAAECLALLSSPGSAAGAGWCFRCTRGPGNRCRCGP